MFQLLLWKPRETQFRERCYSLLSRVGQIFWNQCSALITAKAFNSLMNFGWCPPVELASCQTRVITEPVADLHAQHLSMFKMRQLARNTFGGLKLISNLRRQLNHVLLVKNLLNRQNPPRLLYGPGQGDHGNNYMYIFLDFILARSF